MSRTSLQSQSAVREVLRKQLQEMDFSAFEQIMKRLLYRSGYVSVHLVGRNHKRGRTPQGGLDMSARSVTDLSSALTIAQVKQYKRVVSRRFVDELRGAMLRLGAEQGLLLTMSTFSKVAHHAAQKSNVAPVKLIEGEEILDLLFAYRIGVVEKKGQWQLDQAYLDKLQERFLGAYGRETANTADPQKIQTNSHQTNSHKPLLQESLPPPKLSDPPNQVRNHDTPNISLQLEDHSGGHRTGGEVTWSTHLMAGLNTLWLLEAIPGAFTENVALLAGAAALGSLLPDLDASESKIKYLSVAGVKPFFIPSQVIYQQLGHRSFLHSLLGLTSVAIVCAALSSLVGWKVAFALWLGYGSHLLADASTRSGIPLLYPMPRRFYLLPKKLRLVTGSVAEEVVFVLLSLSVLALLLHSLSA